MLKRNDNKSYKFMCVTMDDPAMGMLEIEDFLTVVSLEKSVLPVGLLIKCTNKQTIKQYMVET